MSARRTTGVLLLAALAALAVDGLLFRLGAYAPLLSPNSTAGAFERALTRVRDAIDAPGGSSDVVVFGDSRMTFGLSAAAAGRAAHGIRFVNAAVPGTTPRCWRFLVREIDPARHPFRAAVIPVDAYADDARALGAADAWDHIQDFRYVALHVRFTDVVWFARSVHYEPNRRKVLEWLLLPGRAMAADVQELIAHPIQRWTSIRSARRENSGEGIRDESLRGLTADFARDTVTFPPGVAADERAAIRANVLARPVADPGYGAYRREMLGDIVARLQAAHVRVIFVRIPTRPLARPGSALPRSGALTSFVGAGGAELLSAERYRQLERPEYFADEHHLNRAGRAAFSALLGRDIAARLGR